MTSVRRRLRSTDIPRLPRRLDSGVQSLSLLQDNQDNVSGRDCCGAATVSAVDIEWREALDFGNRELDAPCLRTSRYSPGRITMLRK